jgi:hypothetical protein
MIFFYLLVLTYTIDGNDTFVSQIAFRDQSSCANAMDEIFPTIRAEYWDSMAQCLPTDTPSSYTIRPKPRPTK